MSSEAKRRKVDAALRFLGCATTWRGDVGFHELAERGGVAGAKQGEDVRYVSCGFAFACHEVGNLSRRNLDRFLRRREPKVVEWLSRLTEGKDRQGFLALPCVRDKRGGGGLDGGLRGGGDFSHIEEAEGGEAVQP